jgi:hypothetical protein
MAENRYITVHFKDGTRLGFSFPSQSQDDFQLVAKMQKLMDGRWLSLEVKGDMFMIPVESIKYVQGHPAPDKLPDTVIRGARLIVD